MNKIITAGCMALAATTALAMPNKQELERAKPVVENMTKADLAAFKSGEKTAQKVAAAHLAFAEKAENESEKYLLCQGAFKLYARSGEYNLAADAIQIMKRDIKDIPPAVIAEIVGDELRYVSDGKAPRLVVMLKEAKNAKSAEGVNSDIIKECLKINDTEKNATVRARKVLAKLFPGWSLDSQSSHPESGFHASHRGQSNVLFVHPNSTKEPVIISRTVTLPNENPCLFIKVASWGDDSDYLLSVRVDGKTALPDRIICTPDCEPWQDIVVPLSDWRGHNAKIEIVLTANNWWCEASFLARIEIGEGHGDMRIVEGQETIDGYTWSYRAQNGEATIVAEKNGAFSRAVFPFPVGPMKIPSTLNGAKVTHIGRNAFRRCHGMTEVTIPNSVVAVGRDAFAECHGLTSVLIPDSVRYLDWGAFGNCFGLESVMLPVGIRSIGRWAFVSCHGLSKITIPASVTDIGGGAFENCAKLKDVMGLKGVKNIGAEAFRGSIALRAVEIPSSVTNIHHTAFRNTGVMTSISVDNGNRYYQSAKGSLLTKDGKTLVWGCCGNVMIPVGVTNVAACAFEGRDALLSIVIPRGVKNIGEFAFKNCGGLTSVAIPSSVNSIRNTAFDGCGALTLVTMQGERPEAPNNVFANCANLKEIHVPANAKSWAGMKEWQGRKLVFDAKEK